MVTFTNVYYRLQKESRSERYHLHRFYATEYTRRAEVNNKEYTPTADEMRNAYASYCQETYNQTYGSASAEFDRFIETMRVSGSERTIKGEQK